MADCRARGRNRPSRKEPSRPAKCEVGGNVDPGRETVTHPRRLVCKYRPPPQDGQTGLAISLVERRPGSVRRTLQAPPRASLEASGTGRSDYADCAADGIVDTLPARDTMNLTPVLTGPKATLKNPISGGVLSRRRGCSFGVSRRGQELIWRLVNGQLKKHFTPAQSRHAYPCRAPANRRCRLFL